MKLDGKVVVITGGNQGIGKGIARLFGSEGAKLSLCARNEDKLNATADALRAEGIEVFTQRCDVSDEDAVQSFFDATVAYCGRVDILVNNAGAFDGGPFEEVTFAGWNNVIGACLTGTFLCSRAVFPIMRKQGGGRILNIGSISAQRSRDHTAPYVAAKFGVWGLTQSIALDGREHNIVCSCLHPGNVRVERRIDTDLESDNEPMMETETIANAALAMVTLPDDVNFLEAIVLPRDQLYLGRG